MEHKQAELMISSDVPASAQPSFMERLISTLKKFTGSEEDQGLFSAFFQGPDGNDSDDSSSSDSDDGEYGLEYNVRGEEQFEKPLALSISDSVSVDSGSGKSISSKSKKK